MLLQIIVSTCMIQEYGDPNSPQASYEWAIPFQNINREETERLSPWGKDLIFPA